MKKALLIAVLLLTVNFIYAQTDTLRYENGSVFIGDTQKSYGTLYTTKGDIYIGLIKDGLPDSICTHYTKNGSKEGHTYYGEFKEGVYSGKGRVDFRRGEILICDFIKGKPFGVGIFYFRYATIYHGEIRNGRPHGEGKRYSSNAKSYSEGRFEKGIFVEGYRHRTKKGVSQGIYISGKSSVPAVTPTSSTQATSEYAALRHELNTHKKGEKLTKEQIEFSLSLKQSTLE